MADIKQVIQSMLEKGMPRDEVIENLRELGFAKPEEVFDRNAPPQPKPLKEEAESEPEGLEVEEEGESKSLFGGSEEKKEGELFGEEPEEKEERLPEEEAVEEKEPEKEEELQAPIMTSVSAEGVEKPLGVKKKPFESSAEKGSELMQEMPKTRLGDLDEVETKLDETIALLKALQEINKKIIETDRKILLRLEK